MALDELGWRDIATQGFAAGVMGILGRMLALAAATKRPAGISLLWEIPLAIGMGVIGKGIADSFGLHGFPNFAVIIAVSYTGPRVIDLATERYAQSKKISSI